MDTTNRGIGGPLIGVLQKALRGGRRQVKDTLRRYPEIVREVVDADARRAAREEKPADAGAKRDGVSRR